MEYILTITKGWHHDHPSYFTARVTEESNGFDEVDFFRGKSAKATIDFINKMTKEYCFEPHNLFSDAYMIEYLNEFNQYSEWNIYSR